MTDADLDFLKAHIDRHVEIDTRGGEHLRIKVLFVFDQESDPDLFFEVIPSEDNLVLFGEPTGGYSLPLDDIVAVRGVSLPE